MRRRASLRPEEEGPQLEKPLAGPRATALQVTWLYVDPDKGSQKVDRVQIGREMVVAEKSGPWMRVYANTDIEEMQQSKDTPIIGSDDTPPPISGWIRPRASSKRTTPNGDQMLMGAAANQEALASDPRGPVNAAQSARLLYRRLVEMFPNSPLVPEAAWRSADIQWQIEKADASTLRSAHDKDAYMREQMDEDPLRKVIKQFPHTRWADLAAFDLIDNKLCGDWQGSAHAPRRSRRSTRNMPTNTPTDRAPPRPFTRPSTGKPCSKTCLPPTATTRSAKMPITTPMSWLPAQRTLCRHRLCLEGRGAGVQIG